MRNSSEYLLIISIRPRVFELQCRISTPFPVFQEHGINTRFQGNCDDIAVIWSLFQPVVNDEIISDVQPGAIIVVSLEWVIATYSDLKETGILSLVDINRKIVTKCLNSSGILKINLINELHNIRIIGCDPGIIATIYCKRIKRRYPPLTKPIRSKEFEANKVKDLVEVSFWLLLLESAQYFVVVLPVLEWHKRWNKQKLFDV